MPLQVREWDEAKRLDQSAFHSELRKKRDKAKAEAALSSQGRDALMAQRKANGDEFRRAKGELRSTLRATAEQTQAERRLAAAEKRASKAERRFEQLERELVDARGRAHHCAARLTACCCALC